MRPNPRIALLLQFLSFISAPAVFAYTVVVRSAADGNGDDVAVPILTVCEALRGRDLYSNRR